MILTYSLPKFKDLILSGEKIHTIREDKNRRWKPGMKIQHWMGNPRNVKKEPYQFASGECKAVQWIHILRQGELMPNVYLPTGAAGFSGRWAEENEILEIAKNDGLTIDEFRDWFVPEGLNEFVGRIIHFTDKTY